MHKLIAITIATLVAGAASVNAQTPAPAQVGDTAKGKTLVDPKGMTLYVFDKDEAGKSNCTGQCAQNWPPLKATSDAPASGDWSVITRDDGSKQWAYKGKPVYSWAKDSKPGDIAGDGLNNNTWHVIIVQP